jgi:hypothetical protein
MRSAADLQPDSRQIRRFFNVLFAYADPNGFVSLRVFPDDEDRGPPFEIVALQVGDISEECQRDLIIDNAIGIARMAAKAERPAVFAPPIATFKIAEHARKQDLLQALTLSVECDQEPNAARAKLEQLLGPATVIVRSGGIWTNGCGEFEEKLHGHWRWDRPSTRELEKIKEARSLAQRIVNADPSGKPAVHPFRWPGSWHRKREPRLCEIVALNPERELSIDAALELLRAAAPPKTSKATSKQKATAKKKTAPVGETDQSPSGSFYHECAEFFEADWTLDEIEDEFVAHPERYEHTSRNRYMQEGRLRDQIEECHRKWSERGDEQQQRGRKQVRFLKGEAHTPVRGETLDAIGARVAVAIHCARVQASAWWDDEAEGSPPATLVRAPTGTFKSTNARDAAVAFVMEHPDKTAVIAVPLHKLGDEQLDELRRKYPNVQAAVWRGRHADDPETDDPEHPGKKKKMCWRSNEAAAVEAIGLSVEHCLCKQGRGKIRCPFFELCGFQRQKQIGARIWLCAHECLVHKSPKPMGQIGLVVIDESPLDAFMFGLDPDDPVTLPLDALREPAPAKLERGDAHWLERERHELYDNLDRLTCSRGATPVAYNSLRPFAAWRTTHRNIRFEWEGKRVPDIRPDMTEKEVLAATETAIGNFTVFNRVRLWRLIEQISCPPIWIERRGGRLRICLPALKGLYGRIQVRRRPAGDRVICMVGMRELGNGWEGVPVLICDATGDAELLRVIWPQLHADPWPQPPRPASVRTAQVVDSSFAKAAIAIEGKNIKQKERAALRVYAAVLALALQYGGAPVSLLTYKSTREWIEANCFVPSWLKLGHLGEALGSNKMQSVRAHFVVGRLQPPPEVIAQQEEALAGDYVVEREYENGLAYIPIVPDAQGHTAVAITLHKHPGAMGGRLLSQVREGGLIQAEGRARPERRGPEQPLDIWRFHDVPLPELGPVIPLQRDEVIRGGLDALMLAAGGAMLENAHDAVKVYETRELFTLEALRKDRQRRGGETFLIGDIIRDVLPPPVLRVTYQRRGSGCKPARALFLAGVRDPRGWLEHRLGPLVHFVVEGGRA